MPVRAAGLLGFGGGVVLLAAFLVPLEEGANTIRLLLFAAGLAATGAYQVPQSAPPWTPEALELLDAVPSFMRPMTRRICEELAAEPYVFGSRLSVRR